MTVTQLLEKMQELVDEGFEDLEVKIAFQPGYPLAGNIANVASPLDLEDPELDDDSDEANQIWIAVSDATGYATSEAWG